MYGWSLTTIKRWKKLSGSYCTDRDIRPRLALWTANRALLLSTSSTMEANLNLTRFACFFPTWKKQAVCCCSLLASTERESLDRVYIWVPCFTRRPFLSSLISSANWSLRGCVNPSSWLPLTADVAFTQPITDKYALTSIYIGPVCVSSHLPHKGRGNNRFHISNVNNSSLLPCPQLLPFHFTKNHASGCELGCPAFAFRPTPEIRASCPKQWHSFAEYFCSWMSTLLSKKGEH